jgi:acyl carrier protein
LVTDKEDYIVEESDIRNKIKEAIANVSDIELEDIPDDASFKDDLGLDSLVLLEISVDIELQFGLEVSEEDLAQLHTLQDAVELVQQALVKQD